MSKSGFNWSARNGPVSGPISAACWTVVFVLVSDVFDAPRWGGLAAGLVAGVLALGAGLVAKLTFWSALARSVAWVLLGGWTMYALAHPVPVKVLAGDPFWWANSSSWYALFMLTLAAVVGNTMFSREISPEERRARALRKQAERYNGRERTRENVLADEWERRFARVCNIGRIEPVMVPDLAVDPTGNTMVQARDKYGQLADQVLDGVEIFQIAFWTDEDGKELGTGFTLDGVLPAGGCTWREIAANAIGLAADRRLPTGCGVSVEAGADRGSFIAHVQIKDALGKDYPYDESIPLRTIKNPLPIGIEPHGRQYTLPMYRHNTTLVGAPDSGKTNAENVIAMRYLECVDTLLFDIDTAGGGVTAPFLPPGWLDEDPSVPQPGVACAGPCVELAWVTATILLRMIAARKSGYADLKEDGMVPLGASLDQGGVPHLMVRVDEGGALYAFGAIGRDVRDLIEQVGGQGRPALVRVLYGAVGCNDSFIPVDLQRVSPNRIALKQPNEGELSRYLDWEKGVDTEILQHPGMSLIKEYRGLTPVKLDHLSSERKIRELVTRVSPRRPVLDQVSVDSANAPILLEYGELIAFFRGRPGVTENGTTNDEGEFEWDGTLTLTNFWDNRWQFILPRMMPKRFGHWVDEQRENVQENAPAAAMAGATTATAPRGATMATNEAGQALTAMAKSDSDLNAAMANLEKAAVDADAKRAEKESTADDAGEDPELPDVPAGISIPDYPGDMGQSLWPATDQNLWPGEPTPPAAVVVPAPRPQQVRIPTAQEQSVMVLGYIIAAGDEGVRAGQLRAQLQEAMQRHNPEWSLSQQQFFSNRLNPLRDKQLIHQPHADGAGEDVDDLEIGNDRRKNWVATDLGRRWHERQTRPA